MSIKKKKKTSKTSLKKKAWSLLSKIIRMEYADEVGYVGCYTCGIRKFWKEMQAGHFLDGRGNAILFEEAGIRPQCYACNCMKSGNKVEYTIKMIDELGIDKVNALRYAKHMPVSISTSEYEDKIAYYKQRVVVLEKKVPQTDDVVRNYNHD